METIKMYGLYNRFWTTAWVQLNYYGVITEFHGYYEKPKDNVQQQLVYYFYSVKTRNYYANINNM